MKVTLRVYDSRNRQILGTICKQLKTVHVYKLSLRMVLYLVTVVGCSRETGKGQLETRWRVTARHKT